MAVIPYQLNVIACSIGGRVASTKQGYWLFSSCIRFPREFPEFGIGKRHSLQNGLLYELDGA